MTPDRAEPTQSATPRGGSTIPTEHHPQTGSRTVKTPRRKTVLLAVVAVLVIAVPAAAQTAFRDVPSRYVHSPGIEQLRAAGVTNGCGDGTRYCPNDAVSRGAMASFLTRGGAQAYGANSATTLAPGSDPADPNVNGVPVTLDVTGAGERGGRQQVVLQGSVTVTAEAPNEDCDPCEVQAYVYRARGSVVGPTSFATLDLAGDKTATVVVPVDWATRIDSTRTEQYRIAVFVDGTAQPDGLRADGTLNAVTAPFGSVSGG